MMYSACGPCVGCGHCHRLLLPALFFKQPRRLSKEFVRPVAFRESLSALPLDAASGPVFHAVLGSENRSSVWHTVQGGWASRVALGGARRLQRLCRLGALLGGAPARALSRLARRWPSCGHLQADMCRSLMCRPACDPTHPMSDVWWPRLPKIAIGFEGRAA